MSLPSEVQVLVVGAGPIGLAAAIALDKLGLQVAVVDAALKNPVGSRAAVIHSHTLEVLDTISLAEPLIQAGNQSKGVWVYGKTDKLMAFDVSQLHDETKFPMSILIPQEDVERIFKNRLDSEGIPLFKKMRVVGIGHDIISPGVEVKFEDGSVVRAQYVVGADGSRSTIRRLLGIKFKDPSTGVDYDANVSNSCHANVPNSFGIIYVDAYLEEPLPPCLHRDRISMHIDNFLLLLPFRTKSPSETQTSHWRLAFEIPAGDNPARELSIEFLQELLDTVNPFGVRITISSLVNASRYRVKAAVASTYFTKLGDGNILLAGDAAHVHSPAGGQGMNLGICDAIAVAHAIHSHSSSTAESKDSVLQHYADLRRNTGLKVMGLASNLTTLITASVGWRRLVRNMVLGVARQLPYVGRVGAKDISGISNRPG